MPVMDEISDTRPNPSSEADVREYQASYTDARGSAAIRFVNDGKILSTRIRGVDFSGYSFDGLEPAPETGAALLTGFPLRDGDLFDCVLEVAIPVALRIGETREPGLLHARIDLTGRPDLTVQLELKAAGLEVRSDGATGYFEDELPQLKRRLPSDAWPQTCFFCQFGDFNPYGGVMLGSMTCYRSLKDDYLATRNKLDVVAILDRSEYIQEIWSCGEYTPRTRAVGYRGGL
jgi:hypothetical protein